jgi:hypothetical protein
MAYGLLTYMDAARREDLMDVIGDVSPDNNPLMTMLGRTTAKGTWHEWLEDYISRPSSVSTTAEGATATFSDLTQPSRRGNYTQIITKTIRVSNTEKAVRIAGMGDAFDYQRAKALRDWKNQAEYALVRGVGASGSSGVARQMIGIDSVVTSHYTARNSGTSLSEAEFNQMVEEVWSDVGPDYVFDTVLVPFGLKRKISSFTAGNTRFIDATDKKLTRPVAVYESDGGVHKIFAHKDVRSAAATPGPTFIGIKEDMWKVSYLRNPAYEKLANVGDSTDGMIVGELTLEYRAERSGVRRTGYNQSG